MPKAIMTHTVESFLKVNKVVEVVTFVYKMFFKDFSAVEDQIQCAPPSSESSLLLGQQFLGLTFQSITNYA